MVARSRGNTHEGKIVLHREGGDQCLRAVPARHTQTVGSPGNGVSRELCEVEPMVEHHGLDPERACQLYQSEFLDLPAARPGIAQEDRM